MKIRRSALLDILCARYPEKTREQHLAAILCGDVCAAGGRLRDPRQRLENDAVITFKAKAFVSRGGDKLDFALETWKVAVAGKIILDAGSSTGGFTQCLLKRGARAVYAVDAGYNQIHPVLRSDPRVILREKTNIMAPGPLEPVPALAVCDLSFRSLRGAARHITGLTVEKRLIALVKPQFEWERPGADFDGIVRGDGILLSILSDLAAALEGEGVYAADIIESPLRGRSGNREFFFDLNAKRGMGIAALREKARRVLAGPGGGA
jgi:23S rRNA (cytidine1920-2'-O)/16S rRNA (cytidine1409-2'-O)-methyltransferase